MIEVAILGGGASALFLASFLKKDYLIIEHNLTIGAKIRVSGGGKCNITNKKVSYKNYKSQNIEFVKSVLKRASNKELLNWLSIRGCKPIEKKPNQLFCPKSSLELLEIFKKEIKNIELNCGIEEVKEGFLIKTSKGVFKAKRVVVATGGVSYKKLGASNIGFKIAKAFGHSIKTLRPALVGLTVQKEQFWFKSLSGIAFRARVRVGNKVFTDNILFSHKGISGPAILNASLYWERGEIEVDFLLKPVKFYLKNPNKQISTQLPLPKRFVKEFLAHIGLKDKVVAKLNKEEFKKLTLLNSYRFAPAGTFGFERAEVTKGGVSVDEVFADSMQSKLVKNLYFIGEVLDVTGELGGYNFQWSFSSAKVAADDIKRQLAS